MALFQNGSRDYLSSWIEKALNTQLEHYVFVCGEALSHSDLIKEHYTLEASLAFMGIDLTSPAIQLVKDARVRHARLEERDSIAAFLGKGFETSAECELTAASAAGHVSPNVQCFVIEQEGEIACVALLSVVNQVAGLWSVSSGEKFRRRGLARAVTQTALIEAKALGASMAILSSSDMGEQLYLSMGWTQIERFELFVTSDTVKSVPGFPFPILKPELRRNLSVSCSNILKGWPGVTVDAEHPRNSLFVLCSGVGNFSVIQSTNPSEDEEWISKGEQTDQPVSVYLAGPAKRFSPPLNFVFASSMPAMIYNLLDLPPKSDSIESNIRLATMQDRKEVAELLGDAFKVEPHVLAPYSQSAGHELANVHCLVLESSQSLHGTVTIAIVEQVAYVWAMAVRKEQRRKGIGSKLLMHAMRHASDQGARLGYLIASEEGAALYRACGWTRWSNGKFCGFNQNDQQRMLSKVQNSPPSVVQHACTLTA